jgi:hypothetical protein
LRVGRKGIVQYDAMQNALQTPSQRAVAEMVDDHRNSNRLLKGDAYTKLDGQPPVMFSCHINSAARVIAGNRVCGMHGIAA